MSIKDTIERQVELTRLYNICIHYFTVLRDQPYTKADEKLQALRSIEQSFPLMKRHLIYMKNKETVV